MQDFQTGFDSKGSRGARAGAAAAQMSPRTWRDGIQRDRINDEEEKKMLKNVARYPRGNLCGAKQGGRVCVLCISAHLSCSLVDISELQHNERREEDVAGFCLAWPDN